MGHGAIARLITGATERKSYGSIKARITTSTGAEAGAGVKAKKIRTIETKTQNLG